MGLAVGCAGSGLRRGEPPPAPAPPAEPAASAPLTLGAYGTDPAVALAPVEAEALELVRARAAPGSAPARASGALVIAARRLAERSAAGAPDPLAPPAVRDAQSRALSFDPAPATYVARGGRSQLREALASVLGGVSASHAGAGAAPAGDGWVVVVLTVQRRARLDPFPREVAPGDRAVLSGALAAGLRAPKVFVTLPSGRVEEAKVEGSFRAPLRFPTAGRYVVEVVAEGASGPAVVALLVVAAGGASIDAPAANPRPPEPEDLAAAEEHVVAALDALRAQRGLPPLVPSPELARIARRHSAAMSAAGKVAHRLPASPGAPERLARAGVGYRRVLENVAVARTAQEAHDAAAASPAHLGNMLDPGTIQVGVGLARDPHPSGAPRTYLTEIFVEPPFDDRDSRLTLDTQLREALWRERHRLGLPPLTADSTLDELARGAAVELQRRDGGEGGLETDLREQALALPRALAATDLRVAGGPEEALRSRNLGDPRFRRVGVGVVKGASRRYGPGRLFVAVIYTD